MQKPSTCLLRICVYAQKIQQMIIIQSSNNPIVNVLRPAQKLQVWFTYIPEQTHGSAKKKQEDKLSKATSSLFPIKMVSRDSCVALFCADISTTFCWRADSGPFYMSLVTRKPVFRVFDQIIHKLACCSYRDKLKTEISLVVSLDMILIINE